MNYKSYLKNKYIARSEDINGEKFGVGKIAFMNFGYGEIPDQEGNLTLTRHNETAFIRFTMDTLEKPTIVSFVKKKQCEELNPAPRNIYLKGLYGSSLYWQLLIRAVMMLTSNEYQLQYRKLLYPNYDTVGFIGLRDNN